MDLRDGSLGHRDGPLLGNSQPSDRTGAGGAYPHNSFPRWGSQPQIHDSGYRRIQESGGERGGAGNGGGGAGAGTRRGGFTRHNSWGGMFRLKHSQSHTNLMAAPLPKCLTFWHLIPLGVGSTIGAGVYVLIGTVAREKAGPALPLSFLIAAVAAGLAALCYAELASRCPSAGSAYHYAYTTVGEVVAWLIGWALILEYTVGGAAVARGIAPNLATALGGPDNLPFILARLPVPGTSVVLDPCAAITVALVTALLSAGIKEVRQACITVALVTALLSACIKEVRQQPVGVWPACLPQPSRHHCGVGSVRCIAFTVAVVTALLSAGIKELASHSLHRYRSCLIHPVFIFFSFLKYPSFLFDIPLFRCFFLQSANFQMGMTVANVIILLFVAVAGAWIGFTHGWPGYKESPRWVITMQYSSGVCVPFGLPGMLAGITFFAFICPPSPASPPSRPFYASYLPFGVSGLLGGAAMAFFSYIGFDTVASTAEEVKHPQRDLPLGIGLSLTCCGALYMVIAAVLVGLTLFDRIDPDTPMAQAFDTYHLDWAKYLVTAGALAALSTTLLGSLLPQPRILMVMARDGLLPAWFGRIDKATGACVFQHMGSPDSLGTSPAIEIRSNGQLQSVFSLTPNSFQAPLLARLLEERAGEGEGDAEGGGEEEREEERRNEEEEEREEEGGDEEGEDDAAEEREEEESGSQEQKQQHRTANLSTACNTTVSRGLGEATVDIATESNTAQARNHGSAHPATITPCTVTAVATPAATGPATATATDATAAIAPTSHRRLASRVIVAVSLGAPLLGAAAAVAPASADLSITTNWLPLLLFSLGGPLFLGGAATLGCINEDEGRHQFGSAGGFHCPWVPWLPLASIMVNVYLMANLGATTWLYSSSWLAIGALVYLAYGLHHSALGQAHAPGPRILDASKRTASWWNLGTPFEEWVVQQTHR
ncbi:unnamed protein product [Closterium sp. Yama58-4]|nr:unnamed protein product [Closterium sp. Yama58-4]